VLAGRDGVQVHEGSSGSSWPSGLSASSWTLEGEKARSWFSVGFCLGRARLAPAMIPSPCPG
jgi:hypothetical protein